MCVITFPHRDDIWNGVAAAATAAASAAAAAAAA